MTKITSRQRVHRLLAVEESGLPLREEWVIHSPLSIEGGKQAARELLALPGIPEAIFVNNNLRSEHYW